jgi:hypothetical protein
MMQTAPTHVTAYRRTINQEPRRYRGAELAPLTPAERIALTIALLNRGLDLIDEFARMSLGHCRRGAFLGHHHAEREPRLRGTTYFRTRPNN